MNKLFERFSNTMKRFFGSRSLKYGTNSIILIAALIAIAVLVNVLVGMADIKWDLTPNKLYSLSDATKEELKNLNKDVIIYGLFDDGKVAGDYKEVTELLGQYEKYPGISIKYVDPDKNPGIFKTLDPDDVLDLGKHDFIVKSGNKTKKLDYYSLFSTQFDQYGFQQYKTGSIAEQGFTGAIKYVTADKTPVVYFTEGHEEYSINNDYRNVNDYLDRNNYEARHINLLTQEKIPEDGELLIIGAPKRDFTVDEADKIRRYIEDSGGKVIFMFDHLETDPDFTNLNKLLNRYNVEINYDRVKENDTQRHWPGTPTAILLDVNKYQIFSEDFKMLLADSRSVGTLKNVKDYIKVTPILQTSDKAVGELMDKSRGQDIKGPLDIAVAVEYSGGMKPAKLIVMGNAFFITDNASQQYDSSLYRNSLYFFLSSMNWMIDKEDEVIVPAKTYDNPRITITEQQAKMMGLLVVIILPLIILGTGMYVYLRRRHL